MGKLSNSLKGLRIMIPSLQTFDPQEVFLDKKVAIVGPADSALEIENGSYIDDFDYVVRINKAPSTWKFENEKYTGTKTDIWFHSFFENRESGGGSLDPNILKERRIKMLVNPRTSFSAYRRTFNFYRKYRDNIQVYHLSTGAYKKLLNEFPNPLRPTVGFTALYAALVSPCSTLFITGFTFFKTPYADGYRDHLKDLNENKKHFKNQGIHDANLEYELFKKFLKGSKCKRVKIDNKLKEILASD